MTDGRFTTEDEWQAAYEAAYDALERERFMGRLVFGMPSVEMRSVAVRVATAIITSEPPEYPDISSVPSVHVERVDVGVRGS